MDGVSVFLSGYCEPEYSRIEYWLSQQKQSGYSPKVFWEKLNDAWIIYDNKINEQVNKNKVLGIDNFSAVSIPLLLDTKGAFLGNIDKPRLDALRTELMKLALSLNLVDLFYNYEPVCLPSFEYTGFDNMSDYLKRLNDVQVRTAIDECKSENLRALFDLHYAHYKNKTGKPIEWINHTRDIMRGGFYTTNMQLFGLWLRDNEIEIQVAKKRSLADITNDIWSAFNTFDVKAYDGSLKLFYQTHCNKIDLLTHEFRAALEWEFCKIDSPNFQNSVEHIKRVIAHKLKGFSNAEILVESKGEGTVKEFESGVLYKIKIDLTHLLNIVSTYDLSFQTATQNGKDPVLNETAKNRLSKSKLDFTPAKLRVKVLELADLYGYQNPSTYLDEILAEVKSFNSYPFECDFFLNIHNLCQENIDKFWNEGHKKDISKWLSKAPFHPQKLIKGKKPNSDEIDLIAVPLFSTTWEKQNILPQEDAPTAGQTETKTDIAAPVTDSKGKQGENSVNVFCKGMPFDIPKKHFIVFTESKSKNGNSYLTIEQFNLFIERAFLGNKEIEKLAFNYDTREKLFIVKRFYEFYSLVCKDFENTGQCKPKYIRLLTDNFANWDYKNISANFGNKVKRKW